METQPQTSMKSVFPYLYVPLLTVLLAGCNGDVFIDDFAPSASEVQLAEGSDYCIGFEAANWDIKGLFMEHYSPGYWTEALDGDFYDADGSLIGENRPSSDFMDGEYTKMVLQHPQLSLTLERTGAKQLRLTDAENIGLEACRLIIAVGNEYDVRDIGVQLEPSTRYRLDSIVYKLDSYYWQEQYSSETFVVNPVNAGTDTMHYDLYPYANQHIKLDFLGGGSFFGDPQLTAEQLDVFGNELPVIPVPGVDASGWPVPSDETVRLSAETVLLPPPSGLLAVCETLAVPSGKQIMCVVRCWYTYYGIGYVLYATNPKTGKQRVFEGLLDMQVPQQTYSIEQTESDIYPSDTNH